MQELQNEFNTAVELVRKTLRCSKRSRVIKNPKKKPAHRFASLDDYG